MSRNKKSKSRYSAVTLIVEIFLCVMCLLAITVALYFAFKYNAEKQANITAEDELRKYTDPSDPYIPQSEAEQQAEEEKDSAYQDGYNTGVSELTENIKENLLSSNSSMEVFQNLFPNDLIVIDNSQYYFFPISDSLAKHDYDDSSFSVLDNGRISYDSDEYTTEIGIDVSKYQGDINWKKVASDGIDFALIRIGIRGYSKGDLIDDDTFEDNIEGALENGIGVGAYFFTQACSDEEAKEEAAYVLDKLEPYNVTYPVIIDVEQVGGEDGRGNAISVEDRTEYTITFCEAIRKAGYTPMIYGNLKTFLLMLDMDKLEDIPKWFAGYTDTPYFPYKFDMWQFTEKANVSGVDEPLDMNMYFIKN